MVKLLMVCPPSHTASDQPMVILVLFALTTDGRPGVGGEPEGYLTKIITMKSSLASQHTVDGKGEVSSLVVTRGGVDYAGEVSTIARIETPLLCYL